MIAFPRMLVGPAEKAGIRVPEDPENYDPNEFPHWHIYTLAQIGRPITSGWTSHWQNAEIVADIPAEEILEITMEQLFGRGFV